MLCGGKGKFSNKKVKVMMFKKTDHEVWLNETAAEREETAR